MTQWLETQTGFIKPRELSTLTAALAAGGIAVIPSDTGYALVCRLGDKSAGNRIRQLRELDKDHPFTLMCADLTHLAHYARVDNVQFRLLKRLFPGAFTCILPASKEVPRLVQHEKRKTIGIRIPDQAVCHSIIQTHGEALMGVSLSNDDAQTFINLHDFDKAFLNAIDVIADCGELPLRPSTVLDLTTMPVSVLRQGAGDSSLILAQS